MDNENKELQGNDTNLTPEEKVQADISAKISEAAEPLAEEIAEANGDVCECPECACECEDNCNCEPSDDECCCACEECTAPKKEPVIVKIKLGKFITSIVAGVVAGALIMFGVYQIPTVNKAMPGGTRKTTMIAESDGSKVVATVNGDSITDLDIKYYAYVEAMKYASENNIADDELASYDWDQEVDGKSLSETLVDRALDTAIGEVLAIQKGAANDITLDEQTASSIDMQVSSLINQYGEENLAVRVRTMGIANVPEYTKMYKRAMLSQSVSDDMEDNASKYYPEDETVLNDYIQDGKASVKHILIKSDSAEGEEAPAEDKKAKAQEILDRIKNGEDFDTLLAEFNEDTGEPETGYTFMTGEMQPEFEAASFALKMGEVSEVVETTYGYHIIKRVPGSYELKAYWAADDAAKINIKERRLSKISIKDIMTDVEKATEELSKSESETSN